MTVKELYARIDGDYAEAQGRLMNDTLIARFVGKFPSDPSCERLFAAWEAGDERAAFEAAHAAKGVCGNLALTRLARLSSDICEALREGNDELRATTDVDALVAELRGAYASAVAAIEDFQG